MATRRQQQIRILDTLESNGWRRHGVEQDCDWWADEIWLLRSDRPPVGMKAWLAFLVDPEWEGARAAGEGICSVAADLSRRTERTGWMVEMPLGRRWERGLDGLVRALETARAATSPSAGGGARPGKPARPLADRVRTRHKPLR